MFGRLGGLNSTTKSFRAIPRDAEVRYLLLILYEVMHG